MLLTHTCEPGALYSSLDRLLGFRSLNVVCTIYRRDDAHTQPHEYRESPTTLPPLSLRRSLPLPPAVSSVHSLMDPYGRPQDARRLMSATPGDTTCDINHYAILGLSHRRTPSRLGCELPVVISVSEWFRQSDDYILYRCVLRIAIIRMPKFRVPSRRFQPAFETVCFGMYHIHALCVRVHAVDRRGALSDV